MTKSSRGTPTTSVTLTAEAYRVKEQLTNEWSLWKVLSAALLLFDQQDALTQKELINQVVESEKKRDT